MGHVQCSEGRGHWRCYVCDWRDLRPGRSALWRLMHDAYACGRSGKQEGACSDAETEVLACAAKGAPRALGTAESHQPEAPQGVEQRRPARCPTPTTALTKYTQGHCRASRLQAPACSKAAIHTCCAVLTCLHIPCTHNEGPDQVASCTCAASHPGQGKSSMQSRQSCKEVLLPT